ncbi:MAG: hypothetical protein R3Y51_00755 [Rikenellaceae bacterium]
MNNKIYYILTTLLIVLFTQIKLSAESYDRIERRNLWNDGRNVTGILQDSVNVAYSELYYNSEQGEYRNFSDALNLWSAGVETKAFNHYDKFSVIGAFSYDHTHGEEMSGSMFISPNLYPFDLLEFTPGEKTLQTYNFLGGISSKVNDRLSIGVKGEFKTQNYAKFKDLRHYNYRMELSLTPSVSYKIGNTTLGLSYIYARNSETVKAQEVGSTAAAYYAFLNKGLMTGAYETWSGTGIHLNESGINGFPVRENFNGLAAQISWNNLYGELEYLYGKGEVGEKQTYWFNFPSHRYSARLGYSKMNGNKLHLFKMEAQYYTLTNNENVNGSVTENGVTTTVTYGSTKVFLTEQLSFTPHYEIMYQNGGNIEAGVNYYQVFNRSTLMYPYVNELTTNCYQAYIGGILPLNKFELRGKMLFSTGDLHENGYQVADNVDTGDQPTQLIEYYNIENEYLTATTLSTTISVRYNIMKSYYAEIGASHTQAFNLNYIEGNSRWGYSLKIGYKF